MTTRTAATYYALLITIVMVQAVVAVMHSGQALAAQHSVADLQREKSALLAERQELQEVLAERHSLLQLQASPVYNQFQPISQVATVQVPTTVAWR